MSSDGYYSFSNILKTKILIFLLKRRQEFRDLSATYLITGMPRGGTTWLAEVLNTLNNSLYLHEPLKKGRIEEFDRINFGWHQYIPEDGSWEEARELFNKLFHGEILNPALIERTSNIGRLLMSEKLIIKFVRLNRMLPWIANNFKDINLPIYIIRHPCAVVYSQMNHGAWDYVNHMQFPYQPTIPNTKFKEFYLEIFNRISKVKSIEQHLAIGWCLDTLPLFHKDNNSRWITLSYEKAVLDKEVFIGNLFDRLGISMNEKTLMKLHKPSSSTQIANPLERSGVAQISKWMKNLSKKQIKDINEILEFFEIDFYNVCDPEPNYVKLLSQSHSTILTKALQAPYNS